MLCNHHLSFICYSYATYSMYHTEDEKMNCEECMAIWPEKEKSVTRQVTGFQCVCCTARECHPDHGAEELLLPVLPPSGDPAGLHIPAHHHTYPGGLRQLSGARTQRGEPFFLRGRGERRLIFGHIAAKSFSSNPHEFKY